MISNFAWPKAQDELDRKLLTDVAEHQCHVVGIPQGEHGPRYSFSVGLFLHFEHPELIVFGLDHKVAATAINDIRDLVQQGRRFKHGDLSDELFRGYRVAFVEVDPSLYHYYLGAAIWFYSCLSKGFPVLQLVWPDNKHRLPWDEGYDEQCKKRQPVLNEKGNVPNQS